mmetsp:Transcript_66432/g.203295  ORF Transcript_66432/g.203295 Transcript_66432/m.203295 type:complete len:224 (+) Transcript_66432:424-1095(+)
MGAPNQHRGGPPRACARGSPLPPLHRYDWRSAPGVTERRVARARRSAANQAQRSPLHVLQLFRAREQLGGCHAALRAPRHCIDHRVPLGRAESEHAGGAGAVRKLGPLSEIGLSACHLRGRANGAGHLPNGTRHARGQASPCDSCKPRGAAAQAEESRNAGFVCGLSGGGCAGNHCAGDGTTSPGVGTPIHLLEQRSQRRWRPRFEACSELTQQCLRQRWVDI